MRRARLLLLAAAAMIASATARAQPTTALEAAKEVVGIGGGWEISNAERDRRCLVTLSTDPAPGGLKLTFEPTCVTVFPVLKDVVAWTKVPNGPLRLLDGRGRSPLELSEVESGIFEGERKGEGLYFMQPQAATAIPVRNPEQMFGDWTFLREIDKTLCRFTLSPNSAGQSGYRLIVQPGCEGAIAAFGLSTWRLDSDELVLTGPAGSWRFVESDTNIWERIPPSTNPLLMIKP
jgi:hypothetical protein